MTTAFPGNVRAFFLFLSLVYRLRAEADSTLFSRFETKTSWTVNLSDLFLWKFTLFVLEILAIFSRTRLTALPSSISSAHVLPPHSTSTHRNSLPSHLHHEPHSSSSVRSHPQDRSGVQGNREDGESLFLFPSPLLPFRTHN